MGYAYGIIGFILEFVFLPLVFIYYMMVPQEKLLTDEFRNKFGWLYANIKTENRLQRAYRIVFVGRRWLLLYFGFGLTATPVLQIVMVTFLNIFCLIYVGMAQPMLTKQKNNLELFNEWMICMITYPCFCFSDALPDQENQFSVGWVLALCFSIQILGNIRVFLMEALDKMRMNIVRKIRRVCKKYGWF